MVMKVFSFGIIGMFIQLLLLMVLIWFISKGCDYIQERGLKHIVNDVWEGSGSDSTKTGE